MTEKQLRDTVLRLVLTEAAKTGTLFVPVMSSSRHVHLSQRDVDILFGPGYLLTKLRDLIQPGQYACNERVTLETPKGAMALRVVGPTRSETQVELTATDAVKLGLTLPVRMSGDLAGSPGCSLTNNGRRAEISQGVIIAARHLHLSPEEAVAYALKDGDVVSLAVVGQRETLWKNVIVRSGKGHLMEAHMDTDEANACGLTDGQLCKVMKPRLPAAHGAAPPLMRGSSAPAAPAAPPSLPPTLLDLSTEKRRLLTEEDVRCADKNGFKRIRYAKDAIVTPLAYDLARDKGIEMICVG